jgi:trans-2,3-dihydro-3-hydroxyanthranilate isomerase
MTLKYCTLDVFTNRKFGGNPLAVFWDAPELPTELMQNIARELNLSETVFIVRSRDARAVKRLRIFTPARELPFAGHPTIGAAHVLVEQGAAGLTGSLGSFTLEEEVGLVPISAARQSDGTWFLQLTTARLPEQGPAAPDTARLARVLSLNERDISTGRDFAQGFSCGVPYLFVPVRTRDALARATPDAAAWREVLGGAWASQVFVFCYEPELSGSDVRARMFAPEFGISEDPATGSAVAAFAGYLAQRARHQSGTLRWTIEQGFDMGRPSLLYLEADITDKTVAAVRVGGTAVRVSEGEMLVTA